MIYFEESRFLGNVQFENKNSLNKYNILIEVIEFSLWKINNIILD
jgi:hypothetical protein